MTMLSIFRYWPVTEVCEFSNYLVNTIGVIGSILGAENIKLSKDMVQSLRASHLERKMVKKKFLPM